MISKEISDFSDFFGDQRRTYLFFVLQNQKMPHEHTIIDKIGIEGFPRDSQIDLNQQPLSCKSNTLPTVTSPEDTNLISNGFLEFNDFARISRT